MKKHIVRVIAVVAATLMLLTVIPAAALQELSLPNLMSAIVDTPQTEDSSSDVAQTTTDTKTDTKSENSDIQGDVVVDDDDYDFAEDVVLGKEYSFNSVELNSEPPTVAAKDAMIDKTLSPYEPYETELENHPFLPGGTAWMDLSKIYYGAPATQNFPLTKWSANTSVYNITGYGEDQYAFIDRDLIDGFVWKEYSEDTRLEVCTTDAGGNEICTYENGVASSDLTKYGLPVLTSKYKDETAYAYNRYDAMQGKYGITLDRNVSSAVWIPSWYSGYYENGDELNNSVLYLSDTPYLYFSTEAPDNTKLAISLLIGTPVQKEVGNGKADDKGKTKTVNTGYFEYRWYTITDNSERPGVDASTMDCSMIPIVTISDVVATIKGQVSDISNGLDAKAQQSEAVLAAIKDATTESGVSYADPLALAQEKGVSKEKLYVDGAITGCIDFTNLLPAVMGVADASEVDKGREDVQYKVAQIRVDTYTGDGNSDHDSPARINYMYFGPSLVTVFSPQNTVGQEISGQAWQYAQTSTGDVGNGNTTYGAQVSTTDSTIERAYSSGWENGAAVSLKNTPNDPQLLTVDTYGIGDGQLIEWADVPAGADILKGSNDSKVWKFTDKNGVVRYMEAELNTVGHSGVDDVYYIMVTVPVRKWINVLGESRKISLNATLLQPGQINPVLKPTFVLWGNEAGSLGCGHGGPGLGARFRNEDLIMVFATDGQCYHCDQGQDYVAAEVDRTIGDSLIYNAAGGTVESWFDMLRSPYTYQETVTGANANNGIGAEHVGYTFITSLRFAMPVGSAISVQNMKGDGNSAGLNTYSATGSIVSAYDGGTGIQPEINITNTLPEKDVTITKTGTGSSATDYTYTQNNYGDSTVKGTISSGAAAYGPMLEESFYTIYDLLDTEMINSSADESHYSSSAGKNKQPVYGQSWRAFDKIKVDGVNVANDLPIHFSPDSSTLYGYVYGGSQFVVYSTIICTDQDRTKWGLVGVLTKNASTEIGWVKMWDGVTNTTYVEKISGVLYSENVEMESSAANSYARTVVKALKNDWVISEFSSIDNNGDFRDGNNTNFEYTSDFRNNSTNAALHYALGGTHAYNPAQNLVSQAYNGPQLKYANKWTGSSGHYSCGLSLQDFYLRAVDGTDLEWGFVRNKQLATNNISMGMTRVFDVPIRLKQGKSHIHQSYPVLYLDYTANTTFKIGLNLRVDGDDKLWTVYGTNNGLAYIAPDVHSVPTGNRYAYLSFEDIMTVDYKDASTIEVTGISLYMWNNTSVSSGNVVLRRCEIWQEETDWLDEIIADNQYSGGNTSTQMNCVVKDSMNIVNDAFFHYHNENADGKITVTKKGDYASGTNIGINNVNKGYEFTYSDNTQNVAMDYWENGIHYKYDRTDSYRKENSNKGWSAYIRLDTTKDGKVDSNDTTYHSYGGTSVENVYEYRTSLGHLRVWVPSETQASVVFESDRSFNTQNYKYLYYSYSMRDVDTGISAEEPDTARTDGLKPGIAVSIKQNQLGSSKAYSEIVTEGDTRTWAYYDSDNPYWSEDGRDNRTFKTTINAALDLSSLDGIDSVNQFVFYLNNPMGTLGDGKQAEFYINYVTLSNVPPSDVISSKINETQYQYYYMMDNTGDRYSARFPTIDNPSGQVSGLNSDNDRVNPIIVERGARLSDGTYFNGDPIYGYGTTVDGGTLDYSTGSDGYYEKTYGATDGFAGSMKNILFYTGTHEETEADRRNGNYDINDFYTYLDRNGDGETNEYDMQWSYGRWDTGGGESGLNTLYIGNPADPQEGYTPNGVSGNLTRRYATENYVLLRAGIEPIKYVTYFDAMGGQLVYKGSSDDITSGVLQNKNNYYIDENVVFSYFKHPLDLDKVTNMIPQKYGYVFTGWYREDFGDVDAANTPKLMKYTKKDAPGINYFFAKWVKDPSFADDHTNTATFLKPFKTDEGENGENIWHTFDANYENQFQLTLPTTMQTRAEDGTTVRILGYREANVDDGPVYALGSTVTLQKSTTFVPVIAGDGVGYDAHLYTVRVSSSVVDSGAKLLVYRDDGDGILEPTDGFDPSSQHIVCTPEEDDEGNLTGALVYSNIPYGFVLIAVPDTAQDGCGWQMPLKANDNANQMLVNPAAQPVCGVNNELYKFSVIGDMDINYTDLTGISDYDTLGEEVAATNAAVMITVPAASVKTDIGREMRFYSQFNLSHITGATPVAYGTLYTKSGANYDAVKDQLDKYMRLDEETITAANVSRGSYGTMTTSVRHVRSKDGAANGSNQYYLMVTENKGNAVTYYARGYVIFTIDGQDGYFVAYSDTVASASVEQLQ